jgi:Rad3-related DNA helicase
VLAFVNTEVPKAASLVAKIDALVKQYPKLRAFVVFQSGDDQKEAIQRLATKGKLQVPLVIPKELQKTVDLFKLNPKARNTFLVYTGKKVHFNAVDVTPQNFSKVAAAARAVANTD